MIKLGVNIDHVATVRQARYREMLGAPNVEPDPVGAALEAERGGAHGITAHLRADRRHIQDGDLFCLSKSITTKLNLEMGNTEEILEIVLAVGPEDVCLVPEEREEVTTEGGLDCLRSRGALVPTIAKLKKGGIRISLFIDPEVEQIRTAASLGVEAVELHTGAFANASGTSQLQELERLRRGAELAHELGLQVNAGHGINYTNIQLVRTLPHLAELNIGHSIVSRALSVGMELATRQMLDLMVGKAGCG